MKIWRVVQLLCAALLFWGFVLESEGHDRARRCRGCFGCYSAVFGLITEEGYDCTWTSCHHDDHMFMVVAHQSTQEKKRTRLMERTPTIFLLNILNVLLCLLPATASSDTRVGALTSLFVAPCLQNISCKMVQLEWQPVAAVPWLIFIADKPLSNKNISLKVLKLCTFLHIYTFCTWSL